MIQRIQTVYLIIIVVLASVFAFSAQAEFFSKTAELQARYILDFGGLHGENDNFSNFSTWLLCALGTAPILIAFCTIFLYKKRMLQIRLTVVNIILFLGYYGLLAVVIGNFSEVLNADWRLKFITCFPLINALLSYLALRGIAKDEALIRSLNRLR